MKSSTMKNRRGNCKRYRVSAAIFRPSNRTDRTAKRISGNDAIRPPPHMPNMNMTISVTPAARPIGLATPLACPSK
jgi:hypothetical protein